MKELIKKYNITKDDIFYVNQLFTRELTMPQVTIKLLLLTVGFKAFYDIKGSVEETASALLLTLNALYRINEIDDAKQKLYSQVLREGRNILYIDTPMDTLEQKVSKYYNRITKKSNSKLYLL